MSLTLLTRPDVVDDLRRRDFLGILAAAGLLAGCGTGAHDAPADASAGYPRTVRHAGGELVLDSRPGRVVAAGPYSELDVLLALGAEPAGVGSSVDPLRSWQRRAGAGSVERFDATNGPDLEALAVVHPDLVVMNGTTYATHADWVEQYGKVCPVLGMPSGIEDQVRLVGQALGIAEDRVRTVLAGVRSVVDGFSPARRPASVVVANYFGDGQLLVWTPRSPQAALFRRLGLPDPTSPKPPADDPDAQIVAVSLERIDLLEADLLLVAQASPGDPAVRELEAMPAFASLEVVRSGRYVRQSVEETFAVGDSTVLSLPVAVAAMERALA